MTLTILVDLDDTLLSNDMDVFIPVYLKALGDHLGHIVEPEKMVKALLYSTNLMMANDSPEITLKEKFDSHFYPALEMEEPKVRSVFEDFYAEKFPNLKQYTGVRQEAIEFVKEAKSRGYKIAIATNPLFPQTATYQRLRWAGLAPEDWDFDLISTYEFFHFAKPNPAYFGELLGQIGWPESPAIMVGNDWEADILPARKFGLPTFFVTSNGYAQHPSGNMQHAEGWLNEILPWIDKTPLENLEPEFNSPVPILSTLKSTPAAIATLLEEISNEHWAYRPDQDEWSIVEIICHLRDTDIEVNLPRLNILLYEDNPFIEAVDADTWALEREYNLYDGPTALSEFINTRKEQITILDSIQPEEWNINARHSILGPTTLQELMYIIARHDRLHIQQIHNVLSNL